MIYHLNPVRDHLRKPFVPEHEGEPRFHRNASCYPSTRNTNLSPYVSTDPRLTPQSRHRLTGTGIMMLDLTASFTPGNR